MNTCNHNEINLKLGKVIGMLEGINFRLDKINSTIERHEIEIKSINKFRNRLIGRISAITAVGGITITVIVFFLR